MPNVFDSSMKTKDSKKETESMHNIDDDHKACHRHVDEYSEVMRAETPATGLLSAFMPKPVSVAFDNQDSSENIVLVLRRHPLTLFKSLLIAFLMLFMPAFLNAVGMFSFLPGNYQFAAIVLWYLITFGFVLEVFLTWFFSVYIITDERIIDVDFISLIYKDISSAKTDKIEDVTTVTGGALQSMFDYGSIKIQTAGAKTEIEFESIPHPSRVTKLLNELMLEEEREKIEGRVN
ncbi:MAG: PH domain-containing protein [Candidatus Pacebacteria bacterium]|nr:PH domain-containing protein [Candidatus Paceibacterota bacterium]